MKLIGGGKEFDWVQKGDKLALVRIVGGREQIVAVLSSYQIEVVVADETDSPAWEKGPVSWASLKSKVASRLGVTLPDHAKPPWAAD